MAATDYHRPASTMEDGAAPATPRYDIRFPPSNPELDQDGEFCEVLLDGQWQRIRFHDYGRLYEHPGLYEQVFYERLECSSHRRVSSMLADVLRERGQASAYLRVLEVGAGNGVVAQELRQLGISRITGVDIIPEARDAAQRDRPGVYDEYFVCDLTNLDAAEQAALQALRPNALVTVAALGYGDIPPAAFEAAFNLVAPGAWIAFNAKLTFLSARDESGFASLLRKMIAADIIEIEAYRVYCHRRSMRGDRLYYAALVARKRADIPGGGIPDLRNQGGVLPLSKP